MDRLINSIKSMATEYFFYFFSWGFYYFSAGTLSYKKIAVKPNESIVGVTL